MPADAPAVVEEAAPAKLNLDLYVLGRRQDGYHELDSIVAFTTFGDSLTARAADGFALTLEGPFAPALDAAGESLVRRAAFGLAELVGCAPNAALTLTKRIPLAAGLGGGSADAAATLRALQRLWQIEPPTAALYALATSLGADVPVCLAGRPARMHGIGDRLDAAPPLPPLELLLVNPGAPAPTGAVYQSLTAADFAPPPPRTPADAWLMQGRNALEPAALRVQPAIAPVIAALAATDATLVRLCGSGATVFAAYPDPTTADTAARTIQTTQPHWWLQRTRLVRLER
ncbi:MAG: 4-(cytidine 5'-diphospho)-2-C-methyl-D-erythritol kinase [Geminicoccaceae bacterium]|nr:MAG: 4-(cytidine 5'-diphospho)-2-C-methyl-D-erythritol kinase [Geminicoccaceae bacterium]